MKNKIYKIGLIILTLALYFYINIAFSQDSQRNITLNDNSVLGKSLFSKSVYEKTDYISPFVLLSDKNFDCKLIPVRNTTLKSYDSDKYFTEYFNTAVISVYPNYAIVIKLDFRNQNRDLAYK